ncbi:MAG: hypothetical protein K9N51_11210, partial [Candidatus Pacebacteria bacterium]|nr:hypothetical protein [Candidatus Paceibacterota bacterium]
TPSRTEARLNAHDLRNEDMNIAWHQGHIRKGHASNGYWEVMVEQPGRYTFELRRWPREAGHDIRAGIDGDDVEFRRECITPESHSWYTGGTALDINTACLKITGQPMLSCPVNDNEDTAVFTVELPAGPTHVQTWFTDNKSLFLSAYYVSVSRMSE